MERATEAQRLANEIASRLAGLSTRTAPAARSVRREYSRLLAKARPDLVVGLRFSWRGELTLPAGLSVMKFSNITELPLRASHSTNF
jgi:hypothetical protein